MRGELSRCRRVLAGLTVAATALTIGLCVPAAAATPAGHGKPMNAGQDGAPAGTPGPQVAQTLGMDVSDYTGNVNWGQAASDGAKFAYVEASDGTNWTNPYFAQQYNGSYQAGLIRGAYHFARPNASSGAAQADFFIAHGGGWSKDGKTLPGALDLEAQPSGNACYSMSASQLAGFATSFVNEYHSKEKVYPVIYTGVGFWNECIGSAASFAANDPLFLASWGSSPGALPHNWSVYTFWQYASSGKLPGDQDYFNGAVTQLKALANG